MSCYLIKVENGHKVARSITSEEEYKLIRGSYEQKANLRLAREGNDGAKRRLVQFNYSGHYPQGVVKGTKFLLILQRFSLHRFLVARWEFCS